MADYRYKAFISYSWADAAWGKWLHNAIETYRTPRALVDSEGAHGPVPARLHPLFKDREEEAAGASIGAAVEGALAASEFLIVVCSPNSARLKWVNHEVAWFKIHRDPSRILALIVDGEPGDGERECFPPALTHRVNSDLSISEELVDAPLAADARNSGDGKRGARLKLAAAMLGVGLDGLVRRDDRRRALRQRWITAGSLLFGGAMAALAWFALEARNEADYQRAQSDGLVEFMLTDLRERLEPVGRLDALDVVGQRALAYYAQQKTGSLDADALGRRSRALHLVGEVSNIRGDSAAGLKAFREAAKATAEQLVRDPDNPQRIFDHAQSVFWVGYIAFERGENREAEAQFRAYKRLADQLLAIDPKKPEWQLESSYAETNLGVMLFRQGRYAEAVVAFAAAVSKMDAVFQGEKATADRQLELGILIEWLGNAQAEIGQRDAAMEQFRREMALYDAALQSDPRNRQAHWRKAIALQYIGSLELANGRLQLAQAAYQQSLTLVERLRETDPANTEWLETQIRALNSQALCHLYSRNTAAAWRVNEKAQQLANTMLKSDPTNRIWALELESGVKLNQARLQLARGEPAAALATATALLERLGSPGSATSGTLAESKAEAGILAGDALNALGRRLEARHLLQAVLDKLPPDPSNLRLKLKRQRFLLLKRLGKSVEAATLASELERQGDRHPAFLDPR